MACVDCHFSQDVHGDGTIYGETRAAVMLSCEDCHGDATKAAKAGSKLKRHEAPPMTLDDDLQYEVANLANGVPLGNATGKRTVFYQPDGPGFVRLTVMDARGAADSVVVRLQ